MDVTMDLPRQPSELHAAPCCVPVGAPPWVTLELITSTLDMWQPRYAEALSCEDALEMLLNVARLCEFLESDP